MELEADFLDVKKKVLDEHVPQLADEVQNMQIHAGQMRGEISAIEKDKDLLISTLHWEAQSKIQKDCELLGLTIELDYCKQELAKIKEIVVNTELSIDDKIAEIQAVNQERNRKLACLEKLVSSREGELSSTIAEATVAQLSLIHKQQELEVLDRKLAEIRRESEKMLAVSVIEEEIHQKYYVFNEIQKNLIERETKDSVFKLRSEFIDGSL